MKNNSRTTAAKILAEVFNKKISLNAALNHFLKLDSQNISKQKAQCNNKYISPEANLQNSHSSKGKGDKGLIQELCYGTLRWYWQLDAITKMLLKKTLKSKDNDIFALLLMGLYQLIHLRIPDHAAISETVQAARLLKKLWATGLINASLRQFQREQAQILASISENVCANYSHPAWLIEKIQAAYPEAWIRILQANNQYPPLTLRVNRLKTSREDYLQKLADIPHTLTQIAKQGVTLVEACDIKQLPGFSSGEFSVQDESAQLAAELLELNSDQVVLDACAAPGGKTAHILETESHLKKLVALDLDEKRLEKVTENLNRLIPNTAMLKRICADAAQPSTWWDGELFDRILLDAPCSATGVIRRHPDIKYLRRTEDIAQLAAQQLQLLNALWPLLKPQGILLYATCSILPTENEMVLNTFLQTHSDAIEKKIIADWGQATTIGRQLLPQMNGHDGFYYAKLQKQ